MNRNTRWTVTALVATTVGLANLANAQVSRDDSSTGPTTGMTVTVGRSTGTGYAAVRGTENGSSGSFITGTRRPPVSAGVEDPYLNMSTGAEWIHLLPMFLELSIPLMLGVAIAAIKAGAADSAHQGPGNSEPHWVN